MPSAPAGYHWLHIPSGKKGVSFFTEQHAVEVEDWRGPKLTQHPLLPLSLLEALELINKWNVAQPLTWKYWL